MPVTTMPKINLDQLSTMLTADDLALVQGIVNSRTGQLRASKPECPRKTRWINQPDSIMRGYHDYENETDANKGKIAYIWRMVAFSVSPIQQHQCMPCAAGFDLPGVCSQEQRELAKQLDAIADIVIDTIPVTEWHGVSRWARVLGY